MPNPFNEASKPQAQPGVVKIINSTLVCEYCHEIESDGDYYESKSLLVFTCVNGHKNQVEMEL